MSSSYQSRNRGALADGVGEIAQLRQIIIKRLAKARIVPLEIPLALPSALPVRENPWTEFIGMFEGDAEFATIAAELRAERELDLGLLRR